MKHGLVCPSRWMRAIACRSVDGFQSLSNSTSRFAPVRLSPTPPERELSRKTKASSASSRAARLNWLTSFARASCFVLPSRRSVGKWCSWQ